MAVHEMLAAITGIEEFQLDKGEGTKLGEAIQRVLKLQPRFLSPERLAYVHLATTIGTIYGPRAIAWRLRTQAERKSRPKDNLKTMPARPAAAPGQTAAPGQAGQATGTAGLSPDLMQVAWTEPVTED